MIFPILLSLQIIFLLAHTSIISQYVAADPLIRNGLIQTTVDDDLAGFVEYVTDLGWDTAAANTLFSFIQRTAAPQLGPGLAFGQFERRSMVITTAIINKIELEAMVYSKNMDLTVHGGISFVYPGIYEISVQFRQTTSLESATTTRAQVRGLISDQIVGRSALFLTGNSDSYNGFNSVSFFINIEDEDEIYVLEILRQSGNTWTLSIEPETRCPWDGPDANIVVVVKNIGQL
eukprot:157120_1